MAWKYIANLVGPPGDAAAMGRFGALEAAMATAMRSRGVLDGAQSLLEMTGTSWNGLWTVGSANTNPGLPATPGTAGELEVKNTSNDHYIRVQFRSGGGVYEIYGSGGSWGSWHRVDYAFAYQGAPAAGTSLATLNKRSDIGVHRIFENRNHPDLPELPAGWTSASLTTLPDGVSSTLQMLAVNYQANSGNNLFWRNQTGPSGNFTDWAPMGASAGGDGGQSSDEMIADIALVKSQLSPETTFENLNVFTTLMEGERYMDWLVQTYPEKVSTILLGESREKRPIRAFQLGDPSKPTYYLMAAQHGSEPMGREAAYLWVRELCQDDSPETLAFLQNACVVVTPVVNVDRINVQRLSSSNTDLNRNWITKTTAEIKAASSVFTTHNVVLTLDAHEGGKWDAMQADIPSAPEVAASLVAVSHALFDSVAAQYVTENEKFERYLGDTTLEIARNAVPVQYKSATILFEGASGLDANMYAPDVAWRRKVYLIAYRAVFAYVRSHLSDFVTAKTSAS